MDNPVLLSFQRYIAPVSRQQLFEFRFDKSFAEGFFGIAVVIIEVLIDIPAEFTEGEDFGNDRLGIIALKLFKRVLDRPALSLRKNINCRAIFAPHLVAGCAAMRIQMDFDQFLQRNNAVVKRNDHRFRKAGIT